LRFTLTASLAHWGYEGPYRITIIEDCDIVTLIQQLLGQIQTNKGVATTLGVDN
jgi:hypothetical protein